MGRRAALLVTLIALMLAIGATPAFATISVSDAAFGNVVVGATSVLTVSVTTDVSHSIDGIAISGTNAADFAIQNDHCTGTGSTTCTFDVAFTPSARGVRGAVATVSGTFGSGDNTSTLSGTGVSPVIQVPANLSFGSQDVGTTSTEQTLTVSNTTTDTGQNLTISGISVSGSNPSNFVITYNACLFASIPPSGSCTVKVAFKPTTTGVRTAFIRVTSNAPPNGINDVPLSGTGVAPLASVTPASLPFDDQEVGTASASKSVTITSVGNADLELDDIGLTGAAPGDYSIATSTCGALPATLHPSESCVLGIRFAPTATGARFASVHLSSNAGTKDVALSGTGLAAPTPSPSSDGGGGGSATTGGDTTPPPSDSPPASDPVPVTPGLVATTPPVGCVVPRLLGKTLSAARRALRTAHCKLGQVSKVASKRRLRGRIVRQRRRAGARLPAGTEVAVAVGRR